MEKYKWMQYILISAGMKFRNKKKFRYSSLYRHIPAHFENWRVHKSYWTSSWLIKTISYLTINFFTIFPSSRNFRHSSDRPYPWFPANNLHTFLVSSHVWLSTSRLIPKTLRRDRNSEARIHSEMKIDIRHISISNHILQFRAFKIVFEMTKLRELFVGLIKSSNRRTEKITQKNLYNLCHWYCSVVTLRLVIAICGKCGNTLNVTG
jgi:hypothetical protein